MEQPVKILGFVGSLSKGLYNKALMRAAVELAPEDATIEVFDLEGIAPFNQDLESTPPPTEKEFALRSKKQTRF